MLESEASIGGWLQRWNHSAHIFWKRYLFYVQLYAKYCPPLDVHCVSALALFRTGMLHGFV